MQCYPPSQYSENGSVDKSSPPDLIALNLIPELRDPEDLAERVYSIVAQRLQDAGIPAKRVPYPNQTRDILLIGAPSITAIVLKTVIQVLEVLQNSEARPS